MKHSPIRKISQFCARLSLVLFAILSFSFAANAGVFDEGDNEAGKKLFNLNCASCHNVTSAPKTGPGLEGIAERWGASEELLIKWIQNPGAALKTGDPYIQSVVDVWRPEAGLMNAVLVTEAQIKDIMAYIANPNVGGDPGDLAESGKGYTTIYDEMEPQGSGMKLMVMILILIFIVILASLSSVSRTLKSVEEGRVAEEALVDKSYMQLIKEWMWQRRVTVGILSFIVFCAIITFGYIDLMGIGVYEAYEPEQPIYFNHAVHAQKHEINCEYCHFTARKSKHASIPHAMLCMNCHKSVNEGAITGSKEIAKIYDAVGWDPETYKYKEDYETQPIEWVKVHNLPDHVFFSHKQHVEVGNVDCKQCHGPVDKFVSGRISPVDEINAQNLPGQVMLTKPTLTMGWCIECHQESKIDKSNGYYQEMHARMIEKGNELGNEFWRNITDDDKISVKDMGGWECAKCHY